MGVITERFAAIGLSLRVQLAWEIGKMFDADGMGQLFGDSKLQTVRGFPPLEDGTIRRRSIQ